MQLYVTLENGDSPHQIRSLSTALLAYATNLETNGRTSGEVGYASEPLKAQPTDTAAETPEKAPPKRTRKPAAAAALDPEPEPDPDLPPDDDEGDDGEESEPVPPAKEAKANGKHNGKAAGDDKALRQEVLERFASYADEAGVLEGKSLLGEFNATKFSEVAGTDLRAFAKRLTVLEAAL